VLVAGFSYSAGGEPERLASFVGGVPQPDGGPIVAEKTEDRGVVEHPRKRQRVRVAGVGHAACSRQYRSAASCARRLPSSNPATFSGASSRSGQPRASLARGQPAPGVQPVWSGTAVVIAERYRESA